MCVGKLGPVYALVFEGCERRRLPLDPSYSQHSNTMVDEVCHYLSCHPCPVRPCPSDFIFVAICLRLYAWSPTHCKQLTPTWLLAEASRSPLNVLIFSFVIANARLVTKAALRLYRVAMR